MIYSDMIRAVNKMHKNGDYKMLSELHKLVRKEGKRLFKAHNKEQKRKNKENGGIPCGIISKE